eukprot:tig00020723_g13475.t1
MPRARKRPPSPPPESSSSSSEEESEAYSESDAYDEEEGVYGIDEKGQPYLEVPIARSGLQPDFHCDGARTDAQGARAPLIARCKPAGCSRPIFAVRFKCLACVDYDLCGDCYEAGHEGGGHTRAHPVVRAPVLSSGDAEEAVDRSTRLADGRFVWDPYDLLALLGAPSPAPRAPRSSRRRARRADGVCLHLFDWEATARHVGREATPLDCEAAFYDLAAQGPPLLARSEADSSSEGRHSAGPAPAGPGKPAATPAPRALARLPAGGAEATAALLVELEEAVAAVRIDPTAQGARPPCPAPLLLSTLTLRAAADPAERAAQLQTISAFSDALELAGRDARAALDARDDERFDGMRPAAPPDAARRARRGAAAGRGPPRPGDAGPGPLAPAPAPACGRTPGHDCRQVRLLRGAARSPATSPAFYARAAAAPRPPAPGPGARTVLERAAAGEEQPLCAVDQAVFEALSPDFFEELRRAMRSHWFFRGVYRKQRWPLAVTWSRPPEEKAARWRPAPRAAARRAPAAASAAAKKKEEALVQEAREHSRGAALASGAPAAAAPEAELEVGRCARARSVQEMRAELLRVASEQARERREAARALRPPPPMQERYRRMQDLTDDEWEKARAPPAPFPVFKSPMHGAGVKAEGDLPSQEPLVEYVGVLIPNEMEDPMEQFYIRRGIRSSYLFRLDENRVIDATRKGNMARFINHSCEPNCYTQLVTYKGRKKVVIFSGRRIPKGGELTYDYKFPPEEERAPCFCGAARCSGFMS